MRLGMCSGFSIFDYKNKAFQFLGICFQVVRGFFVVSYLLFCCLDNNHLSVQICFCAWIVWVVFCFFCLFSFFCFSRLILFWFCFVDLWFSSDAWFLFSVCSVIFLFFVGSLFVLISASYFCVARLWRCLCLGAEGVNIFWAL